MTPLAGAARLVLLMRKHGIVRSDDQQLFTTSLMPGRADGDALVHHPRTYRGATPFVLARPTNVGDILGTRVMTWPEVAMLRLLTDRQHTLTLPRFGNPPDTELVWNERCEVVDRQKIHQRASGAAAGWTRINQRKGAATLAGPGRTRAGSRVKMKAIG